MILALHDRFIDVRGSMRATGGEGCLPLTEAADTDAVPVAAPRAGPGRWRPADTAVFEAGSAGVVTPLARLQQWFVATYVGDPLTAAVCCALPVLAARPDCARAPVEGQDSHEVVQRVCVLAQASETAAEIGHLPEPCPVEKPLHVGLTPSCPNRGTPCQAGSTFSLCSNGLLLPFCGDGGLALQQESTATKHMTLKV